MTRETITIIILIVLSGISSAWGDPTYAPVAAVGALVVNALRKDL